MVAVSSERRGGRINLAGRQNVFPTFVPAARRLNATVGSKNLIGIHAHFPVGSEKSIAYREPSLRRIVNALAGVTIEAFAVIVASRIE
tara:strand:+ start:1544 stop:1807 length:264 start_codon:yes stop_codon:yes gene_type:complete